MLAQGAKLTAVNIANIHQGSDKAMGEIRTSPKGWGQNRA